MKANEGEMVLRVTAPGQSTLPAPLSNDVPTAFCPIKDDEKKVVATIAIQTDAVPRTFNTLVDSWNADSTDSDEDCFVVDMRAHLLSGTRLYSRFEDVGGTGRFAIDRQEVIECFRVALDWIAGTRP